MTLSLPVRRGAAADGADAPGPRRVSDSNQALDPSTLTVARTWHPLRWLATIAVLIVTAQFIQGLATNKAWDWDTFGDYLFADSILKALLLTLELTLYAVLLGFGGGIILAAARLSRIPLLSSVSWVFVWAFRSIPLVVQILIWFNISLLYKSVSLGIPFGPSFFDFSTKSLFSPFVAALIALSLHQAAYAAEIIRAGIISVDQGQSEAAAALGIPKTRQFLRIILPQAMRSIVPNATNEIIGMVKATALLSSVAVTELFYQAQVILGRNGRPIPLLLVATFWYIVITTVLTIGQFYVERYFAKGSARHLPATPIQKLRNRTGHLALVVRRRLQNPRPDRKTATVSR